MAPRTIALLAVLALVLLCLTASPTPTSTRADDSRRAHEAHAHERRHHRHEHHQHHASSSEVEPSPKPPKEFSARDAPLSLYTGATAVPHMPTQAEIEAFPRDFDWCNTPEGRSFCTSSWNQHIPVYCGSCYVHGALHAANDRIKLLLDGKHDVQLARQVILNCAPAHGLGAACDGGEVYDVFEYMFRYGLPDESCQNYVAKAAHHDPDRYCDTIDVCQNCMPDIDNENRTSCWAVEAPIKYYVTSYGVVSGEGAMMAELYARGPITCAFASIDDFDYNYRGGIYVDNTNASDSNHDVEVVGWGIDETTGLKYWKARNSWGTYWGENSFFRIVRGVNNMRFEEECVFALFDVDELRAVLDGRVTGSMFGVMNVRTPEVTIVNHTQPTEEARSKTKATKHKKQKKHRSASSSTPPPYTIRTNPPQQPTPAVHELAAHHGKSKEAKERSTREMAEDQPHNEDEAEVGL